MNVLACASPHNFAEFASSWPGAFIIVALILAVAYVLGRE